MKRRFFTAASAVALLAPRFAKADALPAMQETPMFADQVKSQKGNLGTFEEILKTTDPKLTVREFGRDFMTRRVLVAEGTPKQIADRLETLEKLLKADAGNKVLVTSGSP